MKIHIPNSAFLGNIDSFIKGFDPLDDELLEISANNKWISMHPVVLTMLAALGLKASEVKCDPILATSRHYLERMGLFPFLRLESGMNISQHDSSGRFIPLSKIRNSAELTQFISEMIPLLHLSPEQARTIGYIVSELVRNVLEHAQSEHGAIVAAQYHKRSNTIRIGITDIGLGIKKTINRSHLAETDINALQLALMPGITGTTQREGGTEQNAGAGLFFTKSIAHVNRNFYMIYSGDAMYKLLKRSKKEDEIKLYVNPFMDRHSKKTNLPYWQGTVLGIDISLDITNEFSQLLDLIRTTYGQAVRERKKLKYKQAKFI